MTGGKSAEYSSEIQKICLAAPLKFLHLEISIIRLAVLTCLEYFLKIQPSWWMKRQEVREQEAAQGKVESRIAAKKKKKKDECAAMGT